MSGLAAVICWNEPSVDEPLVASMLARIPHRATDGSAILTGPHCALGQARHATTGRERTEIQPLHGPDRGLYVVADARLDNRVELAEGLLGRKSSDLSEPELLLLGYERWGTGLAERLSGDFAFVIWDAPRRELYAARDPFGVRPLHYHVTSKGLILASEVEQLLALDGVDRGIEDGAVLDYLLIRHGSHRRTFFRAVARLAPGHYLTGRNGTLREVRYWYPPREELRFKRTEEFEEEFRRLFRLAVEARLDSDRPLVAQLSGGLDSSAVVCMADEIYRQDGDGRPPLRLASAVYPGLHTDETPFIDAVASSVRFCSECYDGSVWDAGDEEVFHVAHPWREARPGISTGWRRIALREGARVVLEGVGGDELLFEDGVYRDLAARGRWLTLLRETALAPQLSYANRTQIDWLKDAMLSAWPPPRPLRRIHRRLRPHPPASPPLWLGPGLRERWDQPPPEADEAVTCLSHTQQYTWSGLTSHSLCGDIDMIGYLAARRGIQLSFPFLDTRLVRFVLAVPFQHRLPGGWTKRLLRQALADLLPGEIARRRSKAQFSAPIQMTIQQNLSRYQHVLTEGRWESAPYVERSHAQGLIDRLTREPASASEWRAWHTAWDVLMLEMWLRDLESVRWPAYRSGLPRGRRRDSSLQVENAGSVA